MGEFNGKKFYGYSMETDPDLVGSTWNTKNFEFSCIRPETLQRAIEKVHSDVGASIKQRKSHLLSKLREKSGDGENLMSSQRDADVETHISQAQQFAIHEFNEIHIKTKQMSDGEKNSSGNSGHSHSDGDKNTNKTFPVSLKSVNFSKNITDSRKMEKAIVEEYQQPHPKWVEILEPKIATMQMFDLRHQPPPPPQPPCGYPMNMYGQIPYQYITPSPQMMQAAGYAYNQQNMMDNYGYQNIYTDYDPRAYLVEDSDLEDEMLRREHYTKFCKKRPDIDETNASDETEGCAEFVNIAPQEPYTDMSYLKSTVPMRYSELSEEETQEETRDQHPKVIIRNRNPTQGILQTSSKLLQKTTTNKDIKKKEKPLKTKSSIFAKLVTQERLISNQHTQATKTTTNRRHSKYSTSASTGRTNRKGANHPRVLQESSPSIPEYQKVPLITPSGKSIEQLKAEKVAIFNKMSRSHERLIDALEQLRTKLLEVHVPDSNSDRNRRNRNGFEFSVRFLRNFLYPLKGMIDTMRNTPREQFNSALSNDACNRVAHIYSLFLQAVLTYSKQLRHFMIDQVPQKLTTLLEMLCSTTNMCLEKRLFDRNDAIVECLLNQCSNFLSFLEDLHAQRFVAARECYRKHSDEVPQAKYDLKMFMNDLNMYEPKLVPKRTVSNRQRGGGNRKMVLNPTNKVSSQQLAQMQGIPQPPRRIRKRVKQTKTVTKKNFERSDAVLVETSDINVPKRPEQDVPTQVQNWDQLPRTSENDDSQEILENLQNILQKTPNLDKYKKVDMVNRSILNALSHAQNHQTREVLQPLLKSINAVMDMPEDDNKIENILKAFQMKISIALNDRNSINASSGKDSKLMDNTQEIENYNQCEENASQERLDCKSDSVGEQSEVESENVRSSLNCCDGKNLYDDEDEDGQFYISGEDNSEKRTTRSRKSKLEPLIELINENEAAELYSSDTELYTPFNVNVTSKRQQQDSKFIDMILNPTKTSPYDIPVSRSSQKKLKSPVSQATTKSSSNKNTRSDIPVTSSSKATSSRRKQPTVPQSPAMMRLKQRINSPGTIEGKKRNHFLKKHTRRNPLGSPPPVPAVSPSTSIGCTTSGNASDFQLSNTSSSHKGCSANIADGKVVGSSELSHRSMTHSNIDINLSSFFKVDGNNSSKNASQQPSIHKSGSNKSSDALHSIEESKEDHVLELGNKDETFSNNVDFMKKEKHACGKCNSEYKETPCTLYHGTSPYDVEKVSTKSNSGKNEKISVKPDKNNLRANFDEESLLKERDQFLSLCIRNRLYTNPNFASPWKIFARLSQQLTHEIIKDVESDFNSGVLNFVDDFLELETRI